MMSNTPMLYQIIVSPRSYDIKKKCWTLANWIPVSVTIDAQKLEYLLTTSNFNFDESAKSIGLYSVEFMKGFDIDSGKFLKPNPKANQQEPDC